MLLVCLQFAIVVRPFVFALFVVFCFVVFALLIVIDGAQCNDVWVLSCWCVRIS